MTELEELRATLASRRRDLQFREVLVETWHNLNARLFGGTLREVPYFWVADDIHEDPNVMGVFSGEDDAPLIGLRRFLRDAGGVTEDERYIVVALVVTHEMVHQRLHEKSCRDLDCHGPAFVKEANRISRIMGLTARISIGGDCQTRFWPFDTDDELSGIIDRMRSNYAAAAVAVEVCGVA